MWKVSAGLLKLKWNIVSLIVISSGIYNIGVIAESYLVSMCTVEKRYLARGAIGSWRISLSLNKMFCLSAIFYLALFSFRLSISWHRLLKHSDRFVLPYPVGSLMSPMMDSAVVKLHLCKTVLIVKATTKCAFTSDLRWHLSVFSFILPCFLLYTTFFFLTIFFLGSGFSRKPNFVILYSSLVSEYHPVLVPLSMPPDCYRKEWSMAKKKLLWRKTEVIGVIYEVLCCMKAGLSSNLIQVTQGSL